MPGENGASFVLRERMAFVLAAALSVVGYCRVIAFTANTSSTEALAVAASLFLIVALSIVLGARFTHLPREDQRGRLERGDDDPGGHGREWCFHPCAVCRHLLDGTSPLSVLLPGVAG